MWGSFLQKKVLKSWVELGTGQEYLYRASGTSALEPFIIIILEQYIFL